MKLVNHEKKSIPDQVFDALLEAIANKELCPGNRIPSEHELCRIFDVSRPSIKTAIDRLQLLGIVEQKVGDGTYVKEITSSSFISTYAKYFIREQDNDDLLALRKAIELESYRIVTKSCAAEQKNELSLLTAQIAHAVEKKLMDTAVMYMIKFHQTLCAASENIYFSQLFQILHSILYEITFFTLKHVNTDIINHYQQIYKGIDKKNTEIGLPSLTYLLDIPQL